MSFAIRRVSPIEDRQELLDLLQRNLGASQERRFEWRHTRNPAGSSWSWFVYDQNHPAPVAMASVFPRRMWVDGKAVLGGQVGDFVVDPSHRSLGPALRLQRATFEPVYSNALAFCYDCPPHSQGMATFVRLGMQPSDKVVRYALLLRSEQFLEKRLGRGLWIKPVARAADLWLQMRIPNHRVPGLEICTYERAFGEEFTWLDKRLSTLNLIRASRSAQDLNWRYREDPLMHAQNGRTGGYRVLVAQRGGELLAFTVFFVQSDGVASIVDLFGDRLAEVGIALLEAVIEVCRRQDLLAVHGFCSDGSELNRLFIRAGFRPRETAACVVAHEKAKDASARFLPPTLRWAFTQMEIMI